VITDSEVLASFERLLRADRYLDGYCPPVRVGRGTDRKTVRLSVEFSNGQITRAKEISW
jgi:hypothetical protein